MAFWQRWLWSEVLRNSKEEQRHPGYQFIFSLHWDQTSGFCDHPRHMVTWKRTTQRCWINDTQRDPKMEETDVFTQSQNLSSSSKSLTCKITLAASLCRTWRGNKSFSWLMSSLLIILRLHTAKDSLLPPA